MQRVREGLAVDGQVQSSPRPVVIEWWTVQQEPARQHFLAARFLEDDVRKVRRALLLKDVRRKKARRIDVTALERGSLEEVLLRREEGVIPVQKRSSGAHTLPVVIAGEPARVASQFDDD